MNRVVELLIKTTTKFLTLLQVIWTKESKVRPVYLLVPQQKYNQKPSNQS